MNREQRKPTPTPTPGSSFRVKNGKWWSYGWTATIATIVQAAGGFGAAYVAYDLYALGSWLSFVIGSAVGIGIGIAYNFVAHYRGWQKLHWIDMTALGISWYP